MRCISRQYMRLKSFLEHGRIANVNPSFLRGFDQSEKRKNSNVAGISYRAYLMNGVTRATRSYSRRAGALKSCVSQ